MLILKIIPKGNQRDLNSQILSFQFIKIQVSDIQFVSI